MPRARCTAIVRKRPQLLHLIKKRPVGGVQHSLAKRYSEAQDQPMSISLIFAPTQDRAERHLTADRGHAGGKQQQIFGPPIRTNKGTFMSAAGLDSGTGA